MKTGWVAMLAGGLLTLASPVQARDADLPVRGQIVETELPIFGRRIDLPPGRWRVENVAYGRSRAEGPKRYGAIAGLMLVRPDSTPADGAILVHANLLPVADGWGPPSDCAARDALFLEGAEPRNKRISCSYVRFVTRDDASIAPLPALDGAHLFSARLPDRFFMAGLRVSDRRDVIDIRYLFPPPLAIYAANGTVTDWKPAGHDMAAMQDATISGIDSWIAMARASAQGRLDANSGHVLPAPWSKEAAIALTQEAPAWKMALYRLATYRVVSTMKSFGIAAALAGNAWTGVVIASWRSVTHSIEYFINDLAWEWPSNPPPEDFIRAETQP